MKKALLVVDDEKLIRYAMSAMLGSEDREIVCAATGTEALQELAARSFDLCFLDLHLPDMSGIDIMHAVAKTAAGTKIVIMTGAEVDEGTMADIRRNSALFLTKPFDLDRVKMIMEQLLVSDNTSYRDYESFVPGPAGERKRFERRRVDRIVITGAAVSITAASRTRLSADVMDISEAGTQVRTDVFLEPGTRVRVEDGATRYSGIIRWTGKVDDSGGCCAGIEFLHETGGGDGRPYSRPNFFV